MKAPGRVSEIHDLIEVLPEPALLLSTEGEVLAANPPAARMFGVEARELCKKHLSDLTSDPAGEVERRLRIWARSRTLSPGSLTLAGAEGQSIECRCDGAVVRPESENSPAIVLLRCVPKATSNSRFLTLNRELEALRSEHRRISQTKEYLEERVEERTAELARYTEELKKSRERFRSLVRNSSDIITLVDASGTVYYSSPAIKWVLGYEPEDRVGSNSFDLLHPDDAARTRSAFAELLRDPGATLSLEMRARRRDGSWRWLEVSGTNLLHEPSVEGIVLNSRDITERKQAEDEKARRARVMALRADVSAALAGGGGLQSTLQRCTEAMLGHLNAALARIWTLDDEESVLELQASAGMYTHLDGPYGSIPIGGLDIGLIVQERRPHLTNDAVNDSRVCDREWAEREGMVAFAGYPLIVEDRVVGIIGIFARELFGEDTIEALASVADAMAQGIELKRAEKERRESEERLQAVLDNAPASMYIKDIEGRYLLANRNSESVLSLSKEQVVGKTDHDLFPKEMADAIRENDQRVLESNAPVSEEENILQGDEERTNISTKFLLSDSDGNPYAICGISTDITEQRRAREKLKESEASLAEAQRIAHLGSWEGDARENRTYWSDEMYRIFGFSPQQFVPTFESFQDLVHPDDRERVREYAESFPHEGQQDSIEHRIVRPDGEVRFVQNWRRIERDETGRPIRGIGTVQDITERKQAEEALRSSERRLIAAQRIARVGDWSFDVLENEARWSDEIYRIVGLDPQEKPTLTYKRFLYRVHPDDRTLVQEASREALQGGSRSNIDYRAIRPDGEVRFVHSEYEVAYNASGEAVELVGTLQDVTELRRAEAELREQAAKLEEQARILDLAPVLIRNLDNEIVLWNTGAEQMYGWSEAEALGRTSLGLLQSQHPEPVEAIRSMILEEGRWEGEIVHTSKYGQRVVVKSLQVLHRDEHGEPAAILEVNNDITGQEQAREELRRSEERFRSLVQNSLDVVAMLDAEGAIVYYSPSVETVLGYKPEEFVGRPALDAIPVHPDDLPRVRENLAHLYDNSGIDLTMEMRLRHADGSWRNIELDGQNLLDEPSVNGIVGNFRDITERKRSEAESDLLLTVALEVSQAEDLDSALRLTLRRVCEATGWVLGQVWLPSADGSVLECHPAWHAEADGLSGFRAANEKLRLEPGVGTPGYAWATKKPVWTWDITQSNFLRAPIAAEYQLRAAMNIPVLADSGVVAVLDFFVFEQREEDERLVQLVSGIANQLGSIIHRRQTEEALKKSEQRLRTIVGNVPVILFALDREGVYTLSEGRGLRPLGLKPGEVVGRSIFEVYRDVPEIHENVRRALGGEEVHATLKVGHVFYEVYYEPLRDEGGEVVGLIGVAGDITERKRAEEELQRSEASLAEAQRIAQLGSWEVNLVTGEVYWSDESYRIFFGFVPEETTLDIEEFMKLIHPNDREPLQRRFDKALAEGKEYSFEFRLIRPDGAERIIYTTCEVEQDGTGRPVRVFGINHDITERKVLEEQLVHQAFHDPLTNLPNRSLFMDRLEHALARAQRQGNRVAVLFMDLDNFKVVNDSLGHETGDRLLVAVAGRLRACLRPADTVARFGGDEFAVLLENVASEDEAKRIAERITEELLRAPFAIGNYETFIASSIGIAFNDSDATQPEDLLRNADMAMYEAKSKGRYCIFEEAMSAHLRDRLELEARLRRALGRKEFRVHYQPKVSINSGAIVGMEALVRWEHPEWGLVSPSRFIPIAEETGLIVALGRWVLHEACRQAKEWHEQHPSEHPLMISVNLSAKQFNQPNLVESIAEVLKETGLEPRALTLEITESAIMDDAHATVDTLWRLKELGVRISVDDFGTGYSSLSYLKRFPVDYLKIDRSFVAGLGKDPEDKGIVLAVIELAHTLGLKVVAEGVETGAQLEHLREMGCELAQGYYFAEPLPGEAASALLTRPR